MRPGNRIFMSIFLLVSGCANQDIIVQKQAEMGSRIEYLVQENKVLTRQVAALSSEVKELRAQVEEHSITFRNLSEPTGATTGESKKDAGQIEKDAPQKASVTKIELINPDTKQKGETDSSAAEYMKAFGMYSANKYPEAIIAFTKFLNEYPDSEYAVNAQYWVGECYYSLSDLSRALESFMAVAEKYPEGKKVPDSMLKTGYTLFAMKEPEKARAVLESLIEKYPDSTAAAKASERLTVR